ncbi:MAG: hypothetical protein WCP32_05415, partial [Bacteroidota bacterium]
FTSMKNFSFKTLQFCNSISTKFRPSSLVPRPSSLVPRPSSLVPRHFPCVFLYESIIELSICSVFDAPSPSR